MAVLLGGTTLFFLWRGINRRSDLLPAAVIAILSWISQAVAFASPGVAWNDPNFIGPGETLFDLPLRLIGDGVLLAVIGLSAWLMKSRGTGTSNRHLRGRSSGRDAHSRPAAGEAP